MLRYEQHRQKLPRQSAYSPTYGQLHKKPQFNAPLEKTPHKVVVEETAVEGAAAEVVEAEEAEEAAEEEFPQRLLEDM